MLLRDKRVKASKVLKIIQSVLMFRTGSGGDRKFFENLDVKLHFLEIRPPGANELKRDTEFMNLA